MLIFALSLWNCAQPQGIQASTCPGLVAAPDMHQCLAGAYWRALTLNTEDAPPVAIIIEDDPLTLWSLHCLLRATYKIITAPSANQALEMLQEPRLALVICGSPIEGNAAAIGRIAKDTRAQVVALVSDAECQLPENVIMIEKPFALQRLADVVVKSHLAKEGSL